MENVRVQFITSNGELIFDSLQSEKMMLPPYVREKKHNPEKAYITEKQIILNGIAIKVRVVSELSEGLWSPQDITFRKALYYSLLGSVGIGLLMAIIFSIFTSSMITRPVMSLKKAALLISRGDWKTRVQINSGDELEELGDSFNKMAGDLEHLENLRRKMTSDLAHELRNPLMSIQNYIEGMIDEVIKPDQTHLADLHEEVQRLTRLIENIDRLAHYKARRQVNYAEFELKTEFLAYFQRYRIEFAKKEIQFSWEIEDITIMVDKFILKEILQNLLENAFKYTPEGGQVSCSMGKIQYNNNNWLEIIVRDNGIGIAKEDLPFIFERFYRVDPSRSRQTGGTGIGLAITKELVELLNGKIAVKSELEHGAEFSIFIPYTDS